MAVHDIIVPSGYKLHPDAEWPVIESPNEFICCLSNRSFGDNSDIDIDYWTNGAISNAIEEALRRSARIRVLDVGGGYLHRAAHDIAAAYNNVEVTSVDLCSSPDAMKHLRLTSIKGDITKIDLPENWFDVAYSYQVLPYILNKELAIRAIERLLKPDGVAVLDYFDYPGAEAAGTRDALLENIKGKYPFLPIEGRASLSGRDPSGTPTVYISFRKGTTMPPGPKYKNIVPEIFK